MPSPLKSAVKRVPLPRTLTGTGKGRERRFFIREGRGKKGEPSILPSPGKGISKSPHREHATDSLVGGTGGRVGGRGKRKKQRTLIKEGEGSPRR